MPWEQTAPEGDGESMSGREADGTVRRGLYQTALRGLTEGYSRPIVATISLLRRNAMTMTDEEKFLFDLQGYLVIRGALTVDEVSELNEIADDRFPSTTGPDAYRRALVSLWGEPYKRLIDHPRIVPYLVELLGPKFRLDHDYCIFMSGGSDGLLLHGGNSIENDHWYRYKDGVMRNGLSVVSYALSDTGPGDGGFICVPGSHKSNVEHLLPEPLRMLEESRPYVVQPEVLAGDAILFTEALVHGTLPWRAAHERRALLYKYSPGYSTWAREFYDADKFGVLTERQRRILTPPSREERPDVIGGAV